MWSQENTFSQTTSLNTEG